MVKFEEKIINLLFFKNAEKKREYVNSTLQFLKQSEFKRKQTNDETKYNSMKYRNAEQQI